MEVYWWRFKETQVNINIMEVLKTSGKCQGFFKKPSESVGGF